MSWQVWNGLRSVSAAVCMVAAIGSVAEADLGFGGGARRPRPRPPAAEHRVPARVVSAVPDEADERVAARIVIPREVLETLADGRKVGSRPGATRTILAGLALSAACIAVPFVLRASRRTTAAVAAAVAVAAVLGGWSWTQADVPPFDPAGRRPPGVEPEDDEATVVFELAEGEGPVVVIVRPAAVQPAAGAVPGIIQPDR